MMKTLKDIVSERRQQGWLVFSGWKGKNHETVMMEKVTPTSRQRIAIDADDNSITVTSVADWFYGPKAVERAA